MHKEGLKLRISNTCSGSACPQRGGGSSTASCTTAQASRVTQTEWEKLFDSQFQLYLFTGFSVHAFSERHHSLCCSGIQKHSSQQGWPQHGLAPRKLSTHSIHFQRMLGEHHQTLTITAVTGCPCCHACLLRRQAVVHCPRTHHTPLVV